MQRGFKALCHRLHDVGNVLQREVHLHALLLHLAEVEQLIDERKQSLGIAVEDAKCPVPVLGGSVGGELGGILLQRFQRANDERHGGAYLVGYHREEAQTGVAHFGRRLFVEPLHLLLMAPLSLAKSVLQQQPDGSNNQNGIEQLGPPRQPERRMDDDAQRGLLFAPEAIVVGGLHAEGVGAGGNVGVGGLMAVAAIDPILVEALQHVGILVLLRRTVAQRRKGKGEEVVAVGKVEFLEMAQRLRQALVAHRNILIIDV